MTKPEHLYTLADVKRVREKLLQEQGGIDLLTGLPLDLKSSVTDHNHKTQYVRGILHRQTNAVLGKIENLWTRYLSYWYTGTLADFLRKAADYLERREDKRYIHPGFLKTLQTKFNSLNESEKKAVLQLLNAQAGSNAKERKDLFRKAIRTRQFTMTQVLQYIEDTQKGR